MTANAVLAFKLVYKTPATRPVEPLVEGARLPPLAGRAPDGVARVIDFNRTDKPLVVYVFTPPCTWCEKNLNNIRALATARQDHYRFVGLSLSDDVSAYLAREPLGFDVMVGVAPDVIRAYGIQGTPMTLVISPEGRVVKSWRGAYQGPIAAQVEQFFGVTLPGLLERPSNAPVLATERPS